MTLKTKCEERIISLVDNLWTENGNIYRKDSNGYSEHAHIELSDILMAIEKVTKETQPFFIGQDGECAFYKDVMPIESQYDLSKPFSNQSQEFYEFLYSIITNH